LHNQGHEQRHALPIRVMIVDDHERVRLGLSLTLQLFDDLELVCEAADGVEAIEQCEIYEPDVILMDLAMPGMDGVAATRTIHQMYPNIKVIALSNFMEGTVEAVHKAGAVRFLLKNISIDELAKAIRQVWNDKTHD
jgi:DNA-binding NarL/FixJ family response regulator